MVRPHTAPRCRSTLFNRGRPRRDVLRGVRIRLFRFDERFDAAAASVPQTTAFLQSLLSSDVFASGFADVVPSKLDLGTHGD